MKIILVSRAQKEPKTLNLADRRLRAKFLGITSMCMLLVAGVGAALALVIANPRTSTVQHIHKLEQRVASQQDKLQDVKAQAQRGVNGLAVKLGQLQAQSVRLNALGRHLADAGGLDTDEFDFDEPPAVGGPDLGSGTGVGLPTNLDQGIDDLATRFDSQEEQLNVLQDLLTDRKVTSSLRPVGKPVSGGYISSYFGTRVDPIDGHRSFHSGLDIAVPRDTPVHAVASGIVTYAGVRSGYGNVVEVDHGDGYMTRYAHNDKLLVKPGEHVHNGDVLADSGSTGRSTGPHVHFEVWHDGHAVNPMAYVKLHR